MFKKLIEFLEEHLEVRRDKVTETEFRNAIELMKEASKVMSHI
jgi:hypothetical protein